MFREGLYFSAEWTAVRLKEGVEGVTSNHRERERTGRQDVLGVSGGSPGSNQRITDRACIGAR